MKTQYSIITVMHVLETLKKYFSGRFDPKLIIDENRLYIYLDRSRQPAQGIIRECKRNGWEYDAEYNCLIFNSVEIAELVTSSDSTDREQGLRHQKRNLSLIKNEL